MNQNNQNLAANIADKSGKMTPLAIQGKLDAWKRQHFAKLAALATTRDEAERLFTVCMNTMSKSPQLLECSFDSIANCILTCFQLRLYPGPMQECAFIPFKGVATWIPQYQGLVKLSYNGGFVKSISTNVVWEGEHFRYEEGLRPVLEHIPDLDIDHAKAQRLAVYSVIRTRYDEAQVTVLSPRFIAGIRARAPGARKSDSPWNGNPDDVDWMWKKTALKQGLKLMPKSSELSEALDLDNAHESERPSGRNIIDLGANGPAQPMAPSQPEAEPEPPRQEPRQEAPQEPPQAALPSPERPAVVIPPKRADDEPSPLQKAQERVKQEQGRKE